MAATLQGGEWSAAITGRTLLPGNTRYSFCRRLGGPQGRSVQVENRVRTGIRSWTIQPVLSRYNDWATRPIIVVVVVIEEEEEEEEEEEIEEEDGNDDDMMMIIKNQRKNLLSSMEKIQHEPPHAVTFVFLKKDKAWFVWKMKVVKKCN